MSCIQLTTDLDSTYLLSWLIVSFFLPNPLCSVKLKHFEKFQDTTEALAGNGSAIVSNETSMCLNATWSMMHFCVWFMSDAFHSIRHYHWDPQCVKFLNIGMNRLSNRSQIDGDWQSKSCFGTSFLQLLPPLLRGKSARAWRKSSRRWSPKRPTSSWPSVMPNSAASSK